MIPLRLRLSRLIAGKHIKKVLCLAYEAGAINYAQFAFLWEALLESAPGLWRSEAYRVNNWALSLEELEDPEKTWNDIKELDSRKKNPGKEEK